MGYANIHEAFTPYTEHFSGGGSNSGSLDSIKTPFNIRTTDPADDFPNIASNYASDNYNFRYSGQNEWDILDGDIKDLGVPNNQNIVSSPDRFVDPAQPGAITTKNGVPIGFQPVRHRRDTIDNLWNRPVGAAVDNLAKIGLSPSGFKNTQNVTMVAAPVERMTNGGGTVANGAGLTSNITKSGTNVSANANANANAGNSVVGSGVSTDCSDQSCLDMLNHILTCDGCTDKLRKLLGVQSSNNFLGFEVPDINISKLMFWIVLIILIVAVYELLNSLFKRLRPI